MSGGKGPAAEDQPAITGQGPGQLVQEARAAIPPLTGQENRAARAGGGTKRIDVCTSCIKAGKIEKV